MSKIYIPKSQCKAIKWNFWEFYNISFNIEELKNFQNEKWYVNIVMSERREVDQYWNTHYFTLNEWKPKEKETKKETNYEISIEDCPF